MLATIATGLLALVSTSLAANINRLEARTCTNGPTSRSCWSNGFNVDCDSNQQWPVTGVTKKYYLEITEQNYSPDGHERPMMLINGTYPGPTISANWGDKLSITVKNSLSENGTSIHWHGLRQLHSNTMDGTNGVTECPLQPGGTKTYTFLATEYGTSWYHSHYSVQYGNGVVGPIVIHGPASANYDLELPPITLTDWFYEDAFPLYDAASKAPGPPTSDNVLVAGKMTSSEGGSYYVTKLTPGKKHLVRFVNTGINSFFHVGLDNHTMTVIAADFVPVKPYKTTSIVLAIGQRYDVIIEANQKVGNYWLRVGTGSDSNQRGCDGYNSNYANIRAIFRYSGAKSVNPTTNGTLPTGCYDEPGPLVPVASTNVPSGVPEDFEVGFAPYNASGNGSLVTWTVNSSAINIDWEKPTLKYVEANNYNFPKSDNVVEVDVAAGAWTYWVLHQDPNNPPIPHPIHIHGHNFWILAQGDGNFTGALNLTNPTQRDTATLPAGGHLVVAFPADNPGAWLMHCHIPFHVSGGLALQFLERKSDIVSTVGSLSGVINQCKAWDAFENSKSFTGKDDSGLKLR